MTSWDKRNSCRVTLDHRPQVNLMGVDGTWGRTCLLLDISDTGARLEVEGSTSALKAKEFFLVLSSTGLAFRRCQLVWVDGSTVGVHFIKKSASKAV
jgi:PilZ domain